MHLYKFRTISFRIGYIQLFYCEDGGNDFLRQVEKCLLYYTASHSVRPAFRSQLRENHCLLDYTASHPVRRNFSVISVGSTVY